MLPTAFPAARPGLAEDRQPFVIARQASTGRVGGSFGFLKRHAEDAIGQPEIRAGVTIAGRIAILVNFIMLQDGRAL